MILTLSLLKDGEAQDVFDSIQKLACVSKYNMHIHGEGSDWQKSIASIDQLYAYSYQPRTPFTANNGWKIYEPLEEYKRMGVDTISDTWRFTLINNDYKVHVQFCEGTRNLYRI